MTICTLTQSLNQPFAPPSKQVSQHAGYLCVTGAARRSQHSQFQVSLMYNNESHFPQAWTPSVIVNLQVVPMAMGWRALALVISSETELLVTAVEGTWSHDLLKLSQQGRTAHMGISQSSTHCNPCCKARCVLLDWFLLSARDQSRESQTRLVSFKTKALAMRCGKIYSKESEGTILTWVVEYPWAFIDFITIWSKDT